MHGGTLCPCNTRFNNSLPIKIWRKYSVSSPVIKVVTQAIFVHKECNIFYETKQIIMDRQEAPDVGLKKFTEYCIRGTQCHTSKEK